MCYVSGSLQVSRAGSRVSLRIQLVVGSCTVTCWRGVQDDETKSIPCTVNSKVSVVQATTRQGWGSGRRKGGEVLGQHTHVQH